jgi:hypothetical protein
MKKDEGKNHRASYQRYLAKHHPQPPRNMILTDRAVATERKREKLKKHQRHQNKHNRHDNFDYATFLAAAAAAGAAVVLAILTGQSISDARNVAAISHNDTVEALKRASVANDISYKALIAVQRAFVYSTGVKIVGFGPADGSAPPNYEASFDWTNSGSTPTRNLTINIGNVILNNPIRNDIWRLTEPTRGRIINTLGPHASEEIGHLQMSGAYIAEIQKKRKSIYFIGRADYQDYLSDNWHISEQCVELTPFTGDPMRLSGGFGHQATTCPTLNCSDDECRQERLARVRPPGR